MDAAEDLLVTVGLKDTTTRTIGRRVKVNHTLIYHYFGSLDDLLIAVLIRLQDEYLVEERERLLARPFSLRTYWHARMDVVQSGRSHRRMIAWMEMQPLFVTNPDLRPRLHQMRELVQGLLVEAIDAGVLEGSMVLPEGTTARGVADLVWVLSDGLNMTELQGEDASRRHLLPLIDQLMFNPLEGPTRRGRPMVRS
jgi:AcrR family transcriptional regulator